MKLSIYGGNLPVKKRQWIISGGLSLVLIFSVLTFFVQKQNSQHSNIVKNHEASRSPASQGPDDPGSLLAVSMNSTVGVLLDEIPTAMRDRVAQSLIAKPTSFWKARANRQVLLTTYRLIFRQAYYAGQGYNLRAALPLPPESVRSITLTSTPRRATVGNPGNIHDYVLVDYTMNGTLLTDFNSPGVSEPALSNINNQWTEQFTLPVDPELIFQRTRFACMDEAQFPPTSVDSEEADSFYDDSCKVENQLSDTGCHQSELPTMSCKNALETKIGKVNTGVHFEHLAWNQTLADQSRVGPLTNMNGSNLAPEAFEMHNPRVTYRYISPGDCAVAEGCVGGTGWRRLLQFATADRNTGTKPLNIGSVDYFITGTTTLNSQYNIFEFSACHHHYHFTHYGSFSFNNNQATTNKRGFCLQSTNRFSNNEYSPLHNPYANCSYQGIDVGWVDEYKAGLPCQWIDVTDVDTSHHSVTGPLTFVSNPDGFLCEGNPVLDSQGNPVFELTTFTTSAGAPVYRPKCNFYSSQSNPNLWLSDNTDSFNVTIQGPGQGYVTSPCTRGQHGPLRNCGFQKSASTLNCTPGAQVTLSCSISGNSTPTQVVRVCESSAALHTGTACTYQDSLVTKAVDTQGTNVTFTCPVARNSQEQGGLYSIYTAALFDDDARANVTCH